jgi:hypothetical protein
MFLAIRPHLVADQGNFRPFGVFCKSVRITKSANTRRSLFLLLLLLAGCLTPKGNEPPEAWNNLNAGMTREEISALIGRPASYPGASQDTWRKGGWELQVTYDENGRARDILRRLVAKR